MHTWHERMGRLGSAAVIALGAATLYAGFHALLCDDAGAGDLALRWKEQQYVLRHKNPFAVYAASPADKDVPPVQHSDSVDADLGLPTPGYPPWSYGTGILLFFPTDTELARVWFALVNLAFIACVVGWHYRLTGQWRTALLFAGSALAADSFAATLGLGQLGVIVVGGLVTAHWMDANDRPILAGVFLGIALIKPTLSLPFVLPFALKGRWLLLAVAGVYNLVAASVVWAIVGDDPLTMLGQLNTATVEWQTIHCFSGYDIPSLLMEIGLSRGAALRSSSMLCLALTFTIMWLWRRASTLTLFALAAVCARRWVGHFHYDDVILVFILFALAQLATTGQSRGPALVFAGLALMLFLPRTLQTGMAWDHLAWRLGAPGEFLLLFCEFGATAALLVWTRAKTEPSSDHFARRTST